MKKKNLLLRLAVLVTAMMCALGAAAVEAYACYTPSNTTLTFYYDDLRSSRPGTTFDLDMGPLGPGWIADGIYAYVTQVVFDPSFAGARPTTTSFWFYNMQNLQSITGMEYLNTSEVIDMSWMFDSCNKLTSLYLGNFNTFKVYYMTGMFFFCSNLQTIYVGDGWTTAGVGVSVYMFSECTSLVGGQGTTYDSNYTGKDYAHIDGGPSNPGYFTRDPNAPKAYACYTESNTTLTFYYDNQRSSRPGTTYDLNTGSDAPGWYDDGTKANVTQVVFDPSFDGARPTTTRGWFCEMRSLQSITGMSYLNTSQVTTMDWMFSGCSSLAVLDLSSFNTSKVTNMSNMFYGSHLRTIYVDNGWTTDAVTNSYNMFDKCGSLVGGQGTAYNSSYPKDKTYAHIDGGPSNPGYFTDVNAPRAYVCYTPSNTTLTFCYDTLHSSRPGTIYALNIGNENPGWMDDGTNASVTKVVFDPAFANVRPKTTRNWFYMMVNLESITGMDYLNTSEVNDMSFMFYDCGSLTSLDVSHFNTSQVVIMMCMFHGCSGLTSLDLSSFNTPNVNTMVDMFVNSNHLRTIYVGDDWTTDYVTHSTNMFYGCTSLVGGQGTTFSYYHLDKTYAHIDGGPSNPGYFTEKPAFKRGDVNGDGDVDISDVTALINYVLTGNSTGLNLAAANVNGDSGIDISDVTALIGFVLTGTW